MTSQRAGSNKSGDCFGLVGTLLDGKYQINRVVAEGGFGVVYAGDHNRLRAPIAIKVLKTPPDLAQAARENFVSQFIREAQTIARVRHSNIVQVLDVGASAMPRGGTAPWMVLEWLTGNTLQQDLRARRGRGGRTPAESFGLMEPMLEAIAVAHEEGVAHRDLKPANIMLLMTKRGVSPRVLDFGIAKLMEGGEAAGSGATLTRGTSNSFSPLYAAPEQVAGTRTGPWTDVHALGLIFSELLTDRPPYPASDMALLFSQVLATERPTPRKVGVDAGPLEEILQQALAFKPEDRFQNAGDFLSAIQKVVRSEPFNVTLPLGSPLPSAASALQSSPPPAMPFESSDNAPVSIDSVDVVRSDATRATGLLVPAVSTRPSATTLSSSVHSRERSTGTGMRPRVSRGAAIGGGLAIAAMLGLVVAYPRMRAAPARPQAAPTTAASMNTTGTVPAPPSTLLPAIVPPAGPVPEQPVLVQPAVVAAPAETAPVTPVLATPAAETPVAAGSPARTPGRPVRPASGSRSSTGRRPPHTSGGDPGDIWTPR